MSNPVMHKGAFGCALGIFLICISIGFSFVVFIKCFGLAMQHNYDLPKYISALFTRDALMMYFYSGLIFFFGLYLSINGMIRIFKEFFEV